MSLISESTCRGYVSQRRIRLFQLLSRKIDPQLAEVLASRDFKEVPKLPRQLRRVDRNGCRNLMQLQ